MQAFELKSALRDSKKLAKLRVELSNTNNDYEIT